MQNQDKNKVILSMTISVFLYTIIENYFCLKHVNILSQAGETWRSKNIGRPPFFFSVCIWECSNQIYIVVRFMSPVSRQSSPVQQEYFRLTNRSVYKVYSRYEISTVNLENFVIDDVTRFHLASVISKERTISDARKVFIIAKKRGHGSRPRYIITDGLKSYIKAVKDEFHTVKKETIHISNIGIRGKHFDKDDFDNNLVERLHGTIRERNKTQRGLKDEYSAFIRGHQLYYNFIRPHMSLFDSTPAEVANVDLNLGSKKWENLLMQSIKYHELENKNEH